MRIIRSSDCPTTPWKNGGGATTEIAVGPDGASLETFDWRLSMARVACDGPFSEFVGIDRTLVVVEGDGMILTVGNDAPVTLSRGGDPIGFPGDVATSARLTNGAITDLNVMTRRTCFSHSLRRIIAPTMHDFADGNAVTIVLSVNGRTTVASEQDSVTLHNGDAAVIRRSPNRIFRVHPTTGECYLILLHETRAIDREP